MTAAMDFESELLAAVPALRAFAVSPCGKSWWADDMVHETLVKAWAKQSLFQPCSRMQAWLFTKLRHEHYSEYRRRRHEVPDPEGLFAARIKSDPAPDGHVAFRGFPPRSPGWHPAIARR
jgi:RNA polymerase sigma-70 factor (ECF subfamily)